MPGKEPEPITSDQFLWAFITWMISRWGGIAGPEREEPAPALSGKVVTYSVQLRAEHVAALRSTAAKRGTTVTRVLNEALDRWLSEEWAKSQG